MNKYGLVVVAGVFVLAISFWMIASDREGGHSADVVPSNGSGAREAQVPEGKVEVGSPQIPVFSLEDAGRAMGEVETVFDDPIPTSDNGWAEWVRSINKVCLSLERSDGVSAKSAEALIVGRAADTIVENLMREKVRPEVALRVLDRISFRHLGDEELKRYVLEMYPDKGVEVLDGSSLPAIDLAGVFEEGPRFPSGEIGSEEMLRGLIEGRNVTAVLLIISGARLKLEAARIYCVFLERGGSPGVEGERLVEELGRVVGDLFGGLEPPFVGAERPSAATFGLLIDTVRESLKK